LSESFIEKRNKNPHSPEDIEETEKINTNSLQTQIYQEEASY
jgi:hypothetical protein